MQLHGRDTVGFDAGAAGGEERAHVTDERSDDLRREFDRFRHDRNVGRQAANRESAQPSDASSRITLAVDDLAGLSNRYVVT